MQFNFPSLPKRRQEAEVYFPQELELWTPIEEKPGLNRKELQSIIRGDQVIDTMHIALPSFLMHGREGELGYCPCLDFNRYFIVAKLLKSNYLVFHEERVASKNMQHFLLEGFKKNPSAYYFMDAFFAPFFGGITPQYYLFERAAMSSIPETLVLFRDIS